MAQWHEPRQRRNPRKKKKPANKIARNKTQLAWVWSKYKAKIEHDKSEIFRENNTLNQEQITRDRTSGQIPLSKEELIARNIRSMSTRSDQTISDRRGFNKVEKFIFSGIAILTLAAIVNYESKIRTSHSMQKSAVSTRGIESSDKDLSSHNISPFDPRAIEFVTIASENITKANSLQHQPELDEALSHLRKFSNSEVKKAIRFLMNVRDPATSASLEPIVNNLKKIIAD